MYIIRREENLKIMPHDYILNNVNVHILRYMEILVSYVYDLRYVHILGYLQYFHTVYIAGYIQVQKHSGVLLIYVKLSISGLSYILNF